MDKLKKNNYIVGVVILNYKNYQDTLSLLNDLLEQKDIFLSIVIVDNDSPNESFNVLKDRSIQYKNVYCIKSKNNQGYASGNNIGIKFLSTADFIFIINPDVRIDNTFLLKELIILYNSFKDIAFIAPIINTSLGFNLGMSCWSLPTILGDFKAFFIKRQILSKIKLQYKERIVCDCLAGSFFGGSKKIFEDIGYFDEGTFLYNEENILGYKVKMKGLKNLLITNLFYHHNTSSSIDTIYTKYQKYQLLLKSKLYYWKYYGGHGLLAQIVLRIGLLLNHIQIFAISTLIFLKSFITNKINLAR